MTQDVIKEGLGLVDTVMELLLKLIDIDRNKAETKSQNLVSAIV